MAVQHHLDIEQTQNYGTNIHPGQEVFIGVSIALTTTHPGVRTRFYPQERDCYFQDEVVLKHLSHKFYRYSMGNCLTEAYLQNTEKKLRVERLIRVKTEDVILESRFSTRIILKWPGFESLTFIKNFGISYLFLNETIKNFILSQFRHKSCFSSRSR